MPIIGFTQFLNDLGHFSKFLKLGPFLAIFQIFHFFEFFHFLVWKTGEKNFSRKMSFLVPKLVLPNFWTIWGIFGNFSNFSFSLKIFRVFWSEKKKFSRKMSFFSAHNWFYPISERFGAFFKIFKIWAIFGNFSNFSFFWIFLHFLVWKIGEKNFLEKCHFLVPKIGFTQFLNDLGAFLAIFKIRALFHFFFHFLKFFSSFLVWKTGEKNFLEKCHF